MADLLEAGLMTTGDALRFKRPRQGETYRAVVTASGTLALDGGQEFRSPSRAAMVAADMKAVDGWHAWTMAKSGKSLDWLRQQLLDGPTPEIRWRWLSGTCWHAGMRRQTG